MVTLGVEPLQDGAVVLQVVNVDRCPRRHVGDDHGQYDGQILDQVFIPHMHAMGFTGLKLGQDSAVLEKTTLEINVKKKKNK